MNSTSQHKRFDPDPYQLERQDPDPHQTKKKDPDPNPHDQVTRICNSCRVELKCSKSKNFYWKMFWKPYLLVACCRSRTAAVLVAVNTFLLSRI
jgi:hypothetical protein